MKGNVGGGGPAGVKCRGVEGIALGVRGNVSDGVAIPGVDGIPGYRGATKAAAGVVGETSIPNGVVGRNAAPGVDGNIANVLMCLLTVPFDVATIYSDAAATAPLIFYCDYSSCCYSYKIQQPQKKDEIKHLHQRSGGSKLHLPLKSGDNGSNTHGAQNIAIPNPSPKT